VKEAIKSYPLNKHLVIGESMLHEIVAIAPQKVYTHGACFLGYTDTHAHRCVP
jgi:hypothetical protein